MVTAKNGKADIHTKIGWLVSLLFFLIVLVYATSIWGRATAYLPSYFSPWPRIFYPFIQSWWYRHVFVWSSRQTQNLLFEFSIHWFFGLILPAVVLLLFKRNLTDMGIGPPNIIGRRMAVVCSILSLPFGLWLIAADAHTQHASMVNAGFICGLLAMIPEHFLICGVTTSLMLPGRKLPHPTIIASPRDAHLIRILHWIGLAQPPVHDSDNRLLAWFDLNKASLAAVICAGTIFGLIHVGKGLPELVLSFPGGMAVSYITLRSRSIWPAILAHWAMNIIPLGIWALLG